LNFTEYLQDDIPHFNQLF